MTALHELVDDRTVRACLELAEEVQRRREAEYARKQAIRDERDRKIKELMAKKTARLAAEKGKATS